jgi:hypothetical protein
MTARIFISYRTSDGVDKATALARELNAAFGDEKVFLDKEDLPAGLPWRDAIGATLDGTPVLLLLVTPHTFGERIADANDPVRREVEAALRSAAHVIPLLADGVEQLPGPQQLPEPLRALGERTWRRLRAYDWREDIERLLGDLQQLGLNRIEPSVLPAVSTRRRVVEIGAALGLGLLSGALGGAWWARRSALAAADAGTLLSGAWTLRAAPPANEAGSRLDAVKLHLTQAGEDLKLYSEPIDISSDPAWAGFARQWQVRFDSPLDRVVWRGAGRVRLEAGAPPNIDVGLRVETPAGGEPIETGKLSAEASRDGQRLVGRVWMNGEQAERAAELTREH